MLNWRGPEVSDDTRYYAFALATTRLAKADLRSMILERLARAVELDARERAGCRDTDVAAATRVRPWRV
jgi:hypothetical protein